MDKSDLSHILCLAFENIHFIPPTFILLGYFCARFELVSQNQTCASNEENYFFKAITFMLLSFLFDLCLKAVKEKR